MSSDNDSRNILDILGMEQDDKQLIEELTQIFATNDDGTSVKMETYIRISIILFFNSFNKHVIFSSL